VRAGLLDLSEDAADPMLAGGLATIKWIGNRRVDSALHPDPRRVWPVRIVAGGFGERLPRRDLWLSPNHAVFVDGVLIPIKHLINGCTIAQEPCDEVTYYHIELERPDVLLDEGLPSGILSRHRRPLAL
jgi:hypothetical protein